LAQGVKVQQAPVYSFFAEGNLALSGTLDAPLLDGTLALTRGQVNLFTSQFALATRAKNIAVFSPEEGLDPRLQVTMSTAVTETSRRRSAFTNTSTSEIQESNIANLGSLQTIRINAKIEGPASQLLDNITLNSSPSRSQAEIVSLIGGGFVDTLGLGGDSTLALANLAGSALLGNLQGAINSVLTGPVELRLFPTIVEAQDRKGKAGSSGDNSSGSSDNNENSTVLALGAEVGVNINNSTSFSALKLLTLDLPTQYNLRYQLNENLTLRGTTDLQGDNRFVVDYEARF
jgi:translocation and assembly module TamB